MYEFSLRKYMILLTNVYNYHGGSGLQVYVYIRENFRNYNFNNFIIH